MKKHGLWMVSLLMWGLMALVSSAQADDWVSLFDGNTLKGWKANENPDSFSVVDGAIVCKGPRSHLFYVGDGQARFKNFEFQAEVMARHDSNSGIFIHTYFQAEGWPDRGYEIQVNNTHGLHGDYLEQKKTGSLYGIRNVYKQLVGDEEWFTLYVKVVGKRIQVKVNQWLVVDYTEETPVYRPGRTTQWVLGEGTFALQCHDPESQVFYKNIRVNPLPDNLSQGSESPVLDEVSKQIIDLGIENFPLIDLHGHLKGGLTLEQVYEKSRKDGIYYGIAVNGGKGFPVETDQGIYEFLESMKGESVFIGMQAEGREWVNMFSKEAIQAFDYVFTDSMTFTDDKGRRMRLWIPDEVFVEDKQQFMEMLVKRIETILSTEPIDIYVNPTYLPAVIAAEYDTLWTPERMQRVIDVALKNGVAIEINSRFKIPSVEFVKRAKQAGCMFTLGTNNGGIDDLGRMDYSLHVIKECHLTWNDMFVPQRKR